MTNIEEIRKRSDLVRTAVFTNAEVKTLLAEIDRLHANLDRLESIDLQDVILSAVAEHHSGNLEEGKKIVAAILATIQKEIVE